MQISKCQMNAINPNIIFPPERPSQTKDVKICNNGYPPSTLRVKVLALQRVRRCQDNATGRVRSLVYLNCRTERETERERERAKVGSADP